MAKFKIDDWVSVKGSKLKGARTPFYKLHILEIITQKCEAGIVQTSYLCRLFVKDIKYGWSPSTKEARFREMELEKRTED